MMLTNRRILFRVSLRAVLLLLTIACIWLGKISMEARRQRDAVEWVKSNGGSVRYDAIQDRTTGRYRTQPSIAPQWLQDALGIDFFRTVTHVDLTATEIMDISPLARLTSLEALALTSNHIEDISPISKLRGLRSLSLTYNQVTDLSPLRQLTSLEYLGIDRNGVSDISSLASLHGLLSLRADNNSIKSIEPLRNLTKLRFIQLNRNMITDLSPVENLPELRTIEVYGNPVNAEQLTKYRTVIQ